MAVQRKRRRAVFWIGIALMLAVPGVVGWRFGPRVYENWHFQRFVTGNAEERSDSLEALVEFESLRVVHKVLDDLTATGIPPDLFALESTSRPSESMREAARDRPALRAFGRLSVPALLRALASEEELRRAWAAELLARDIGPPDDPRAAVNRFAVLTAAGADVAIRRGALVYARAVILSRERGPWARAFDDDPRYATDDVEKLLRFMSEPQAAVTDDSASTEDLERVISRELVYRRARGELSAALQDECRELRWLAFDVLAETRTFAVRDWLTGLDSDDQQLRERFAAQLVLTIAGRVGNSRYAAVAAKAAQCVSTDPSPVVRSRLCQWLGELCPLAPSGLLALVDALGDVDPTVRDSAIMAVLARSPESWLPSDHRSVGEIDGAKYDRTYLRALASVASEAGLDAEGTSIRMARDRLTVHRDFAIAEVRQLAQAEPPSAGCGRFAELAERLLEARELKVPSDAWAFDF